MGVGVGPRRRTISDGSWPRYIIYEKSGPTPWSDVTVMTVSLAAPPLSIAVSMTAAGLGHGTGRCTTNDQVTRYVHVHVK